MDMAIGERRRCQRVPAGKLQGMLVLPLSLTEATRVIPGRLVDMSADGLRVEMLVPLIVGSEVFLNCEFRGDQSNMEVEGRARVAYCESSGVGCFASECASNPSCSSTSRTAI